MPRALSSSKLEEQDTSTAATEQYGENLNIPGGKNILKIGYCEAIILNIPIDLLKTWTFFII